MASKTNCVSRPGRLNQNSASWPIALISLMLQAGGMAPALGQAQSPHSEEQGSTPMQQLDMAAPQPWLDQVSPAKRPAQKPVSEQSPLFCDAKFSGDSAINDFRFIVKYNF